MNREFEGRRVLITGGLGFIGSNLARRLARLGADVTLVDSLIPEYGGNLRNVEDIQAAVRINIADVRDEHSMNWLVQGKDYLFNLAGQTSHLDSMADPYTDLDINCRAQLSILEACRKYNRAIRVVFASTRQVYGVPSCLPVDETHLVRPVDVNGVNKAAGESYHLLYDRVHDIWSCALRLTNTYGPAMRVKDARQTFLGIWIRRAIERAPFQVFGGNQIRDFNFVEDAIDAFLLAATRSEARGKVYNLGAAERYTLKDVAEMLVRLAPGAKYEVVPFPAERQRIDIGDFYADFGRIAADLGWSPKVRLEAGLAQTIDYFRGNARYYWDQP